MSELEGKLRWRTDLRKKKNSSSCLMVIANSVVRAEVKCQLPNVNWGKQLGFSVLIPFSNMLTLWQQGKEHRTEFQSHGQRLERIRRKAKTAVTEHNIQCYKSFQKTAFHLKPYSSVLKTWVMTDGKHCCGVIYCSIATAKLCAKLTSVEFSKILLLTAQNLREMGRLVFSFCLVLLLLLISEKKIFLNYLGLCK